MKLALILSTLIIFSAARAELLDKVLAVFNDQILTKSEVERVIGTSKFRKQISPKFAEKKMENEKDIVDLMIQTNIIRNAIIDIGYNINDEQVEEQIKTTEKRFNIGREELKRYLDTNGFSFEEYYELIREDIEFSVFIEKIIIPSISITEQEIKNYFYKKNSNSKTMSFKYLLVDFSLPSKDVPKSKLGELKEGLQKFQVTGVMPASFSSIETTNLGEMTEEGMDVNLKNQLKNIDEGSFSDALEMNGQLHVFFVQKKDLVESDLFLKSKNSIKAELFAKRTEEMLKLWVERATNKYYIKYFL